MTSSRASCCRASTIASRRASTASRFTRGAANWSSRRRRPRPCVSRSPGAAAPETAPKSQPEMASSRPRVGYLGPEGTFSEEALLSSAGPETSEPGPLSSIRETVTALREGEVEWSIVPIENSLEGSIGITLDLLAGEPRDLEIVGEALLRVSHSLIGPGAVEPERIETLITPPQVPGQCAGFLRTELPHARVLPSSSTAEAVRSVVAAGEPSQAALGTLLAARIYGGTVLREGVEDRSDNETRFVWVARAGSATAPPLRAQAGAASKTSLV